MKKSEAAAAITVLALAGAWVSGVPIIRFHHNGTHLSEKQQAEIWTLNTWLPWKTHRLALSATAAVCEPRPQAFLCKVTTGRKHLQTLVRQGD